MNNNYCPECGTQNEDDYVYCKNCGVQLRPNAKGQQSTNDYAKEPNFATFNRSPFYTEFIDGVPEDEIALFVGAKAHKIMPKFYKMELTKTKTSWCWPAAILGYIFGPLGAALWFFYRKMPKIATVFLCIGIALTALTAFLSYDTNMALINKAQDPLNLTEPKAFFEAIEEINSNTTVLDLLADLANNAAALASFIVSGLFGYYFYKNTCVKRVREFKTLQTDSRFYRVGLASIGGVSGGLLALGIILVLAINSIPEAILNILSMLGAL